MQSNSTKLTRGVFRQVLSAYQRYRSAPPSVNSQYALNPVGGTKSPRVPLPSSSDFVADVELAAKKVLNAEMYEYFIHFYCDHNLYAAERLMFRFKPEELLVIRQDIQEAVGAELKRRGICPVVEYMELPLARCEFRRVQ